MAITNPASVCIRPNDTTAYAQGDLIASATGVTALAVPTIAVPLGLSISRIRLYTSITAAWDGVTIRVRLWSAAPTYANGDNGAYSVTTGALAELALFDATLTQYTDGATGFGVPSVGSAVIAAIALPPVTFWDMQYLGTAALTPIARQNFIIIPEIVG